MFAKIKKNKTGAACYHATNSVKYLKSYSVYPYGLIYAPQTFDDQLQMFKFLCRTIKIRAVLAIKKRTCKGTSNKILF